MRLQILPSARLDVSIGLTVTSRVQFIHVNSFAFRLLLTFLSVRLFSYYLCDFVLYPTLGRLAIELELMV